MPVSLLDTRRGNYFNTPEEADEYANEVRRQKTEAALGKVYGLMDAYQNRMVNRRDRELFNQIGVINGAGPLQQAQNQSPAAPGIQIPQDPGGGVNFLSQAQQMAQGAPQAGAMQPTTQPQRPGLLSRIGGHFRNQFEQNRPLSTLEKAMAEARLKQMYQDPAGSELKSAQAEYYRRRGFGGTTTRAPRGLDEIRNALATSEPDENDTPEMKTQKSLLRRAALSELERYQLQSQGGGAGGGEDIQALIEEYQTTSDVERAAELEALLYEQGVTFE